MLIDVTIRTRENRQTDSSCVPPPREGRLDNSSRFSPPREGGARQLESVGTTLGSLETQRTNAVASGTKPVNMITVRNEWVSVVRTVIGNLQRTKAPASAVEQILAPAHKAADLAARRIAERRSNKPAPAPAPAPSLAPAPAPKASS